MSGDLIGEIVVIKRNGCDGARFPLKEKQCTFGRDPACDIRIQIPNVEEEHAKIFFQDGKIWLQNLSSNLPTLLNSNAVDVKEVNHNDIFTITQRSFRFEFPERRKSSTPRRQSSSKKTPLRAVQGSPRTPAGKESLKKSITKLRRNSAVVLEENEQYVSPVLSAKRSPKVTPIQQKENTPENDALAHTPSILKKKGSARRSDKKRISFGPTLSPELFDKTLPPSTPLRKGKSPARRLSEPLRRATPGRKNMKRCSLGTALGQMPIMEEEEDVKDEEQLVDLCDTPPQNLPLPLLPTSTGEDLPGENQETTTSQPEKQENENHVTDEKSYTPKQKRKQGLIVKNHRLATPIRRQIHEGIAFKVTKRKLNTPLRKDIESRPHLKKRLKKIATPLKKEIERKPALKKTKQKLATPIRASIQGGVRLRATKKKLQTPLREEIQKGAKLRQTKPRLPTPLKDEIESKPVLKETKRKMRKSLQDEIVQGRELRSKFADYKQMPDELKQDIKKGIELKRLTRSAPTPLRHEIEEGLELRETKRKMRMSLQSEIVQGKQLQKTKLSAPTPLRKAIKQGKRLRKTKPTAPTPLRQEIKRGVILRKTKKKLDEAVQAEIKQGKELKKTKLSAPTPLRNEIKKGFGLRQTKKKLGSDLQKEIQQGKELRKTLKSAPTPFKNEIKRGLKLRMTKRRLGQQLQNEIKSGTTLAPLIRKALKTPLRVQIKAGVKLRKTTKKADALTGDEKEFEQSVQESDIASEVNADGPETKHDNEHETKRPVLRAKRRMANRNEPMALTAFEIPRRLSEKIEKPAKKRVCRRSTPKKIAELRDHLQVCRGEDTTTVCDTDVLNNAPDVLSPVIAVHEHGKKFEHRQMPSCGLSDAYLSETSGEDLAAHVEIPDIAETRNSTSDQQESTCLGINVTQNGDEYFGLKRMMKTPKASKRGDVIDENLGLQLLLKTPKVNVEKALEVNDDMGLKHLMKTPKDTIKCEAIEEHLGLKRLMKTPKAKTENKLEVNEKLGLKRLMKTPKDAKKCDVVEEHLGLRRLMKTPKAKTGDEAEVKEKLGLKRLMPSPKEKFDASGELEGEFGLRRLMGSPKNKNASVSSPHLDGLFYEMREKRTKMLPVTANLGLRRLMQTPKDDGKKTAPKYSIDPGSLPAVFQLPKDEHVPVEDMRLQELFIDGESCCLESNIPERELIVGNDEIKEQEIMVGTTRRGRKSVVKEATNTRPTRASRRNKSNLIELPEEGTGEEEGYVGANEGSHSEKELAFAVKKEEHVADVPKRVTRRSRVATNVQSIITVNNDSEEQSVVGATCTEEFEGSQGEEKPTRQSRRGRQTASVPCDVIEAKQQGHEVLEVAVNVPGSASKDPGQCDATEGTTTGNSCAGVHRPTRGKRQSSTTKSTSNRRRTRSTIVERSSSVEPSQKQESEEVAIDEVDAPAENKRSLRTRSKRKSIEQVVQEISEKRGRIPDIEEATKKDVSLEGTESDKSAVKSTHKTRNKRRNTASGEASPVDENAGVAEGIVKTPPKMKFSKTMLHPIQEETESQIGTPFIKVVANIEEVVTAVKQAPKTRGRGKRKVNAVDDDKKIAPKAKSMLKDYDDGVATAENSVVPQPDEPVTRASARRTRSKQTSTEVVLVEKTEPVKRKRQTRSANMQESTDTEASVDETESKAKRTRRGTSAPAEGPTRRSSRRRDAH